MYHVPGCGVCKEFFRACIKDQGFRPLAVTAAAQGKRNARKLLVPVQLEMTFKLPFSFMDTKKRRIRKTGPLSMARTLLVAIDPVLGKHTQRAYWHTAYWQS